MQIATESPAATLVWIMGRAWLGFGVGVLQNGQSFILRFRAAKTQPLQTLFMQHTRKDDWNLSSGKGSWQIGQSSSSDLVRPFFMSTS